MSLSSLIRSMAEAGAPVEAIALAVEALEAKEAEAEAKRSKERERKARFRAKGRDRDGTETGQSGDVVSPKKEIPPTPPKEKTTPSVSEAKASSNTPRAELETVLDPNRAAAVLDHRKRIGKPMTAHAAKLLASKFAKCPDPNAAADTMVGNGWQGFEPGWLERPQARGSPPPKGNPIRGVIANLRTEMLEAADAISDDENGRNRQAPLRLSSGF